MDTTGPNRYPPLKTIKTEYSDIIIDSIQVTVDRIVLFCGKISLQDLTNKLKPYDNSATDTGIHYRPKIFNTKERIKTYTVHGKQVSVRYDRYHEPDERQRLIITIDEPKLLVMGILSAIFNELNGSVTVSKIEIAWDFYTKRVSRLMESMENHLWLFHNRKKCKRYKRTYYISDSRKSVKGIRVYPRPKESEKPECLRLELEIHRSIIKKLKIQFPLTSDQLPTNFTNYFNFLKIDDEKLKRAYRRKFNVKWGKINFKATHPLRRYPNAFLQQMYDEDIDGIKRRESSLVKQMEMIKELGLSNHTRFLKPIHYMAWTINYLGFEQGFNL